MSGRRHWDLSQPRRLGGHRDRRAQKPTGWWRRAGSNRSCSAAEHYTSWTGFTGHEPDDIHRLAWEFINAKEKWPAEARAIDRIATLPEVDAAYFTSRVPDLTRSKMFLGWPDHNDQFTLWSHGRVTVSSQSVGWRPEGQGRSLAPARRRLQFPVCDRCGGDAAFREYGDPNVHQRLADGHSLMPMSQWEDDAFRIDQTCFALPQSSEADPDWLGTAAVVDAVGCLNTAATARDAWLGLEFSDEDFVTFHSAKSIGGGRGDHLAPTVFSTLANVCCGRGSRAGFRAAAGPRVQSAASGRGCRSRRERPAVLPSPISIAPGIQPIGRR